MQKLWDKGYEVTAEIERFTVGRDREMDMYLAEADVLGSMAHITMLESIGLLKTDELQALLAELRNILAEIREARFVIEEGIEDVHSQVELMLTRRLGDVGKKIHSGRSRNDQVLVDLKLFIRKQLRLVAEDVRCLFTELAALAFGLVPTPRASRTTSSSCRRHIASPIATRSARPPVTARRSP